MAEPLTEPWRRYKCLNCGYIYDEAAGWPDDGIAPGTRWSDVSDEWICPECGSEKRDFDMVDWDRSSQTSV